MNSGDKPVDFTIKRNIVLLYKGVQINLINELFMKKALYLLGFLVLFPTLSYASFDVNYKYGSKSEGIKEVQEFLTEQGFYTGPITGNFFALTKKAIVGFQKANQLPGTGFWGPSTRAKATILLDIVDIDPEEVNTPIIKEVAQPTPVTVVNPIQIAQIAPIITTLPVINKELLITTEGPFLEGKPNKITILLRADNMKFTDVFTINLTDNTGGTIFQASENFMNHNTGVLYRKATFTYVWQYYKSPSFTVTVPELGITKTVDITTGTVN